jgi:hypothetical protein
MLSRIYLIIGIIFILLYAIFAVSGKEIGDPERQRVPADYRQGGGRSYFFWHSGYRGGK